MNHSYADDTGMKTALKNKSALSIVVVLVAIAELLFSVGAEPQEPVAVAGNHPLASIQTWQPAAAGLQLHLMAVLGLRDTDQLEKLKDQLQQPGSPAYHQWLSSADFARQFGPTGAQLQAVTDWLKGSGFTIDSADLGTREVRFSGSVAQVQQALGTAIVSNGSQFANLTDPQIPASLAGSIVAIFGLNNLSPSPAATPTPAAALGAISPLGDSSRQQALLAAGFLALLQRGSPYQPGRQRRHHGARLYRAAGDRHLAGRSVTVRFANTLGAQHLHQPVQYSHHPNRDHSD